MFRSYNNLEIKKSGVSGFKVSRRLFNGLSFVFSFVVISCGIWGALETIVARISKFEVFKKRPSMPRINQHKKNIGITITCLRELGRLNETSPNLALGDVSLPLILFF